MLDSVQPTREGWEEFERYGSSGFEKTLRELIAKADYENLQRIYMGYPNIVNAYCLYCYGMPLEVLIDEQCPDKWIL